MSSVVSSAVPASPRFGYVPREVGERGTDLDELTSVADDSAADDSALDRVLRGVARAPTGDDVPPLGAGAHVSRFVVVRELGRGGMGVVYLARDPALDRPVALKVLPPRIAKDPVRRRRLLLEAAAAARVRHPNVAEVFEVGEADGCVFVAMAYIDGRSLRELMGSPLAPARCVGLARQLLAGLGAVHAAGLVHRDVKPDNVIVDPSGVVHLLDLGIAKRSHDTDRDVRDDELTLLHTDDGAIVGTPAYMSPEQAVGDAIDLRSDVFSFGVLMYELLVGHRPFERTTRIDRLAAVMEAEVTPPHHLVPAIGEGLSAVVLRCLSRDPLQRFESAAAIIEALTDAESGRSPPVDVRSPTRAELTSASALPRVSRRGAKARNLAAAAVVAVAAVATARGAIDGHRAASTPVVRRSVALVPFVDDTGDATLAWLSTGLTVHAAAVLAASGEVRVLPRPRTVLLARDLGVAPHQALSAAQRQALSRALGASVLVTGRMVRTAADLVITIEITEAAHATPALVLTARSPLASPRAAAEQAAANMVRDWLGREPTAHEREAGAVALPASDPAARAYVEALELVSRQDADGARLAIERARTLDGASPLIALELANQLAASGRDDEAREAAEHLEADSATFTEEARHVFAAQRFSLLGRVDEAIAAQRWLVDHFPDDLDHGLALVQLEVGADRYRDALLTVARLRQLPTPDGEDPRLVNAGADAHFGLSAYGESRDWARRAVASARARGDRHTESLALGTEAFAEYNLGNFAAGIACARAGADVLAELGDRALEAEVRSTLCYLELSSGQLGSARKSCLSAVDLGRRAGARVPRVYGLLSLVQVEARRGDISAATHALADAREDLTHAMPFRRLMIGTADATAGLLARRRVALDEAARTLELALTTMIELGDRRTEAWVLFHRGMLRRSQGDATAARRDLERSIQLRVDAELRAYTAESQLGLAHLELDVGNLAEARTLATTALDALRRAGDVEGAATSLALLAEIAAATGDGRAAHAHLEEAASVLVQTDSVAAREVVALAELAVLAAERQWQRVATRAAEAVARAERGGYRDVEFEARRRRIEARAALGVPGAAAEGARLAGELEAAGERRLAGVVAKLRFARR